MQTLHAQWNSHRPSTSFLHVSLEKNNCEMTSVRFRSAFKPYTSLGSRASINYDYCSMAGRLGGKVAVITGGAAGIGKEAALLFARERCRGIVIADRSESAGLEVVEELRRISGNKDAAVFLKTDVSQSQHCQAMIELAESQYGRLDVLFNNAGVMLPGDDDAETTDEETWDKTMNINVKGVWFGCKYGVPALRRAGGGSIINTASFVALMGAATPQLAYTSSKGAVLAMTRELAVIHAREKIRVNALCPGPVRTELLMSFLDTPEKQQRRLVHVPMGRFGEAKEMAYGALFLASDESSYVTGTEFLVDGGLTAAYVTPE